jgi:hypothetical protein
VPDRGLREIVRPRANACAIFSRFPFCCMKRKLQSARESNHNAGTALRTGDFRDRGTQSWAQRLGLSPRWFLYIALTAVLAFGLKTTLALRTMGTSDIVIWKQDLKKVDSEGWQALYRDGVDSVSLSGRSYHYVQVFSHPPFMLHVLPMWRWLAWFTGLPLEFWVRLTCSLADLGSLWLLCLFRARLPELRIQPAALLVFAASPILVMISGFHGNSDPIMMFFVLLSVYCLEVRKLPALSGAILGLAMGIKIVAAIFAVALLFSNPTIRGKLRFLLATTGVVVASAFPYVIQNPFLILQRLSHYNGQPHLWGWSFITLAFADSPRYHWIADGFMHFSKVSLLSMLVVLSIAMNRRGARWPLLAQCGLLAFFSLFFTPGFAVQYLAWLAPWAVVLSASALAAYNLTAGSFLAVVYTHWCRGFPWYYANAFEVPVWSKLGFFLGLACWSLSGVILLLFVDAWVTWRAEYP